MAFHDEISSLLNEYRESAIQSAATATSNADESNRWARRTIDCYRRLRDTDEGRSAIISLMSEINPHVRVIAAVHSLQWVPESARAVLQQMRDSDGPGAFEAKWALIRFDEGSMSFD